MIFATNKRDSIREMKVADRQFGLIERGMGKGGVMKKLLMLTGFLLLIFVNNTFAITISMEEFNSRTSTYYSNEILPILASESNDDDMRSYLSGLDVNSFVQAILRESYLTTSRVLQDYADNVQRWNDARDNVRDRLNDLRDFRNNSQIELESEISPYLFYMDSDSEPTTILVGGVDSDSLNSLNQILSNSRFNNFDFAPTNPVPEPSAMFLLGVGLIGLAGWGRRKLKKK